MQVINNMLIIIYANRNAADTFVNASGRVHHVKIGRICIWKTLWKATFTGGGSSNVTLDSSMPSPYASTREIINAYDNTSGTTTGCHLIIEHTGTKLNVVSWGSYNVTKDHEYDISGFYITS